MKAYLKVAGSNQCSGSVFMKNNNVYIRCTYKIMVNLILSMFLFFVLCPGEYSNTDSSVNHQKDHQQEQVKASTELLSTVRIITDAILIPFTNYGISKPLWAGNIDLLAIVFSITCITLFLQNRQSDIHKLRLSRKLLFPFHFNW
jgi:hypothetical protein